MRISAAIIIVIISCILVGCSTGFKPNDPYGRYIPKNPKWTLKNGDPNPSGLIQYDCVYVWKHSFSTSFPPYHILRFWSGGQYMGKFTHNPFNLNEVNQFDGAGVGYYKVIGSNLLTEVYTDLNFGQYGYRVAMMENDGSISFISHGSSLKNQRANKKPETYECIHLNGLNLQPDW